MGQAGETDFPEAQSRDASRCAVRVCLTEHSPSLNQCRRQLEAGQPKPALKLIDTLLTELKRLDDKMILTEVHLLESRVYRGVGNFAKAKVRSTSSFPRLGTNVPPGRPHLLPYRRQLDLLPTRAAIRTRPPVRHSPR